MRHDFIALPPQRKTIRNLLLGSSFLLSLLAVSGVAHAAPAQVEGELEVLHVHNFDKTTHYSYFLRGNDGKRYELKFKKHAPHHPSGTKIRVKGEKSGNVLALDSGTSLQVLGMPAPNTFGEQKTAVLMVNFQDNKTQPYTTSQATSVVFGESSEFVKENSAQQTWLNGNVLGWYTLPISQTCDYMVIRDAAFQAATAAGIDLSQYSRNVIVMPKNTSCAWAGLGTVGGNPSTSWMNGSLYRKAVTHEMGHNLGLWHSHSLECGATTLGSSCTRNEYGDFFDTMGGGEAVHYNAFQKERLGWLNYNTSPAIATVESGGGTFTIQPYAALGSGTKAVKVLKGVDATTGQKSWYYVEFRQPLGFDAPLANYPFVINGVLVRMGTEGDGNSSNLLDMTPSSSTGAASEWTDAPLAVGKSYSDSSSGVTISLLSVSSSGAAISVSMNGQTATPTCTHTNPGIAMSSPSTSVAPGTAVTYTVSVTNTDSSACSSTQFNLSSVVPAGWTVSPASATLNLAPGSSGSTSVVVTSPTTATSGGYTVSGKAVNSSATSFTASASTTYTVATSSTTTPTTTPTTTTNKPPVAVSDSAATTAGTAVKISVLVNDSDPEGKALTVKSVGLPARGTAMVNADGTVTYKPNGKFKGSDSFSYTISDGVNTASTTVSVQVMR